LLTCTLTPRLPRTRPPATAIPNRRCGRLQGSKLTGEVAHNPLCDSMAFVRYFITALISYCDV